MQRIVVVGTSGSGKTTLARRLAALLDASHVELDALNWEPGWTPAAPEVFRQRVAAAVAAPRWVADGYYNREVRDLVWGGADTLVWLDFSFPRVLWQVWVRTLRCGCRREVLWSGNRESLLTAFFSRHSILLWVLQTFHKRRHDIPLHLSQPEHAHLRVLRFRTRREVEAWIAALH